MKRIFAYFTLTVAMALGLAAIPAATAYASEPSCIGEACERVNPADTNCTEDAYTILDRRAAVESGDYGRLELRYSPKCHTNWVRFTPWHGIQALLGNALAKADIGGSPWIWRYGIAHSLRGKIGQSSPISVGITNWTSMVTADGTTCMSVGLYETESHDSGMSERRDLGTYNAPCIS